MTLGLLEAPVKDKRASCPQTAGWLRGKCRHGNERWIRLSCKRRDCPVCGELRKRRIAWRIEYGLNILGNGAWFVGTFDWDIPKELAIKTQNHFIRWLRRDQGINVQYAAVWELQKNGRLHLNLILSPWRYLDQRLLSQKWVTFGGGPVVWIEKVEGGISLEVSKLRYKLGNYMAKFEQMVLEGRGINYSREWPKPPKDITQRIGHINWVWLADSYDEVEIFEEDMAAGMFAEIAPGEYSLYGLPEECNCFQYSHKPRDSCSEHPST